MDFIAENTWFQGIGAVRFDLQQGQVVEWVYPLALTDDERSNVAFLSMPDLGIDERAGSAGDCSTMQYQFTTRVAGKQMFGWVVYVEKKDATVERGALQRSFFLLSTFPWEGLACELLKTFADVYLNKIALLTSRDDELYMVKSMLLNHWYAMSEWPDPECCGRFELETPTATLAYQAPCFRRRGYCGRSSAVQCPGLRDHAEVSETSSDSSAVCPLVRYASYDSVIDDSRGVDASELMAKLNRLAGKQTPKGLFGGFASKFAPRPPASTASTCTDSPALPTCRSLPSFSSSASSSISCTPSSRTSMTTAKRLFYPTPPMSPAKYAFSAPTCTAPTSNFPFSELDITKILPCHVGRLHKLWEIMITGEPICVLGVDARRASETVRYLTTLIEPLTFVGDVNPYVTLHNTYVDQLTTCPQRGAVLGCTNPIFLKGLEEFPNVLIVGEGDGRESWFGLDKRHRRKKPLQRMDDQVCGSNMPNELFSERSFASKSTSEKVDVRRTFQERTQRFLEPIHNYITDVIRDSDPTIFVGTTWKFFNSLHARGVQPAALPQPFDVREILGYVAHYVEAPESKAQQDWKTGSDIASVYLGFLSSPTGVNWFARVYLEQYRKFLEDFDDLPTLLAMYPDPQDRLSLLEQIVAQYAREQESPIPDTAVTSVLAAFAPHVEHCRMELRAAAAAHSGSPPRRHNLPAAEFDAPTVP